VLTHATLLGKIAAAPSGSVVATTQRAATARISAIR
jgi:hypothetical protein